jgi:uncharacterized protein
MDAMTSVPSPCISVCKMDSKQGLCVGCGRTLDEIARWGGMSESEKRGVWQAIDGRRVAGGFAATGEERWET